MFYILDHNNGWINRVNDAGQLWRRYPGDNKWRFRGVIGDPTGYVRGAVLRGCEQVSHPRVPTKNTLTLWIILRKSRATDGCWVEGWGSCEHGRKSWLNFAGVKLDV